MLLLALTLPLRVGLLGWHLCVALQGIAIDIQDLVNKTFDPKSNPVAELKDNEYLGLAVQHIVAHSKKVIKLFKCVLFPCCCCCCCSGGGGGVLLSACITLWARARTCAATRVSAVA